MTKMKAGDEIEVDGRVYVVALNAAMILANGAECDGCQVSHKDCERIGEDCFEGPFSCGLGEHLIFKLKGDVDVQV